MPSTSNWLHRLEFEVWQVPGVSRAWRREFADGSYVLVTDPGGYDLPETGGPYSAMALTATDELRELQPLFSTTQDIYRWLRHCQRLTDGKLSPP